MHGPLATRHVHRPSRLVRSIVYVLLVTMVAGCAGTAGRGPSADVPAASLTPAERELRARAQAFDTTHMMKPATSRLCAGMERDTCVKLQGGVLGAGVGIALGYLVCNKCGGAEGIFCCATFAASFATGGWALGYKVLRDSEPWKNEDERLNSLHADLVDENKHLDLYLAQLEKVVEENITALQQLDDDLAAGRITAAQKKDRLAATRANIALNKKLVDQEQQRLVAMQKEREKIQKASSKTDRNVKAEVDRLNKLTKQITDENANLEREVPA